MTSINLFPTMKTIHLKRKGSWLKWEKNLVYKESLLLWRGTWRTLSRSPVPTATAHGCSCLWAQHQLPPSSGCEPCSYTPPSLFLLSMAHRPPHLILSKESSFQRVYPPILILKRPTIPKGKQLYHKHSLFAFSYRIGNTSAWSDWDYPTVSISFQVTLLTSRWVEKRTIYLAGEWPKTPLLPHMLLFGDLQDGRLVLWRSSHKSGCSGAACFKYWRHWTHHL